MWNQKMGDRVGWGPVRTDSVRTGERELSGMGATYMRG